MSIRTNEGRPVNYLLLLSTFSTCRRTLPKSMNAELHGTAYSSSRAVKLTSVASSQTRKNSTHLEIFEQCELGPARRHFGHHFVT